MTSLLRGKGLVQGDCTKGIVQKGGMYLHTPRLPKGGWYLYYFREGCARCSDLPWPSIVPCLVPPTPFYLSLSPPVYTCLVPSQEFLNLLWDSMTFCGLSLSSMGFHTFFRAHSQDVSQDQVTFHTCSSSWWVLPSCCLPSSPISCALPPQWLTRTVQKMAGNAQKLAKPISMHNSMIRHDKGEQPKYY